MAGFELSGKRALVTGASSGIGRALARALAGEGVALAVAARRTEALDELASEIEATGRPRPIVLPVDLSKPGAAADLASRAIDALGGIDVLVNNAGIGIGASQWVGGDGDEARGLFETNFWSPLALTRALVPAMRERRHGVVINVTSMGKFTPFVLLGHYNASKAALAAATDALRFELRGSGVHVLEVVPGPVDTGMLAEANAVPGGETVYRGVPRGTPDNLARLTIRALQRRRTRLVYPRPLAIGHLLPGVVRAFASRRIQHIDATDPRILVGGSAGSEELLAARKASGRDTPTR
jgi:hypothetical protein